MKPHGIVARFSDGLESRSTRGWLRAVRESDLVLYVGYEGPDWYTIRQMVLAVILRKPVIRWWVGTDVLRCTQDQSLGKQARFLARFSDQVVVAPHLQAELDAIGIRSVVIPSVVSPNSVREKPLESPSPKAVLVYLPTDRGPFYGEAVVAQAIWENPDLRFIVVADERHRFKDLSNVESVGWVEDMGPIYDRIGCVLRMPEHDGFPRMAIEALSLGKYVICSQAFPGCAHATGYDDVRRHLSKFKQSCSPNLSGFLEMKRFLTPPPDHRFAELIRTARTQPTTALNAILAAARLTRWAQLERRTGLSRWDTSP